MEPLNFTTLIVFVVLLIAYSKAIDFDEGCSADDEPVQLQVAFTLDQTGTFFEGGSQSFMSEFGRLAPELMSAIDKEYPGTEFGLTLHADWEWKAEPEYQSGSHNNKTYCYVKYIGFLTNRTVFQHYLKKVERRNSGHKENIHNVPYCARSFTLKQRKKILSRSGIIPKDFWKNQKEMYELEEKSEQEGYKEESSNIEERALEARAGNFDGVIKHVLQCLKQTKQDGCIFGDPEGVNTLGF